MVTPPSTAQQKLGRKTREYFVHGLSKWMPKLVELVLAHLDQLRLEIIDSRQAQLRSDAWRAFKVGHDAWSQGCAAAWREALNTSPKAQATDHTVELGLLASQVVDDKIVVSRMALALAEKISEPYNDLALRLQYLEMLDALPEGDLVRPEVLLLPLVQQWTAAGMSPEGWALVQDIVTRALAIKLPAIYTACNTALIDRGVMVTILTQYRIKHSAGGGAALRAAVEAAEPERARRSASASGSSSGSWGNHSTGAGAAVPGRAPSSDLTQARSGSSLTRVRERAQGVMDQLRRFLSLYAAVPADATGAAPSGPLAQALAQQQPAVHVNGSGTRTMDTLPVSLAADHQPLPLVANVEQLSADLRQRSAALKHKAITPREKATIEIVALMFQSILTEDRIPPSLRVWFARLQLPVLRVALVEPEFFESAQHPARSLIDRMGSCVMGFDVVSNSALESEIARIVQVIEQYPETGRKVFQIVNDEFQDFLKKNLPQQTSTAQRVTSVAQQIEEKETITIRYTIELRNTLNSLPVPEAVREFLFKVWAEVLAVSSLRQGAQHAQTLGFKRCASDIVWAASAKPTRSDRARVKQDLPQMQQRLREGMDLLGLSSQVQEQHIKAISDTFDQAFMSKTQAIASHQVDAMAQRLVHLEDYLSDADALDDLALDASALEVMMGMDTGDLQIILDGDLQPAAPMLAWARELQTGQWFRLDHNAQIVQVQYVWHSERKQLYLFASAQGQNYLMQLRRVASYLQTGLLAPQEEESLTLRATRTALAQLEANPERLLQ